MGIEWGSRGLILNSDQRILKEFELIMSTKKISLSQVEQLGVQDFNLTFILNI